jgi:micrococcal nuclease
VSDIILALPVYFKRKTMYNYTARMMRIIDGDTVELEVDMGFKIKFKDRFRLAYINAPELNEEGGAASRDYLKSILKFGEDYNITTIKPDKYGRWLVVIHTNDGKTTINNMMLESGNAKVYQ